MGSEKLQVTGAGGVGDEASAAGRHCGNLKKGSNYSEEGDEAQGQPMSRATARQSHLLLSGQTSGPKI